MVWDTAAVMRATTTLEAAVVLATVDWKTGIDVGNRGWSGIALWHVSRAILLMTSMHVRNDEVV